MNIKSMNPRTDMKHLLMPLFREFRDFIWNYNATPRVKINVNDVDRTNYSDGIIKW